MLTRAVNAGIFSLKDLELPPHIIHSLFTETEQRSVVAALGRRINMPYGDSEWFNFHDHEAQYVGEGQAKLGSEVDVTTGQIKSYKFQKTVRFSVEDLWRDESYQLGLVRDILRDMHGALGRALDYGVIHAIDPRSGETVARMVPGLHQAAVASTLNGEAPYVGVDTAKRKILAAGYVPNGIALDGDYAGVFSTARSSLTEQALYPGFNLQGVGNLEGLRSVVSKTVGARGVEKTPLAGEPLSAIVGDWNQVVWGIQKSLRTETFDVGDPDNTGRDLAGHNEIAYRVEIVYGWGILDLNAFAAVNGSAGPALAGVNINTDTVTVEADDVFVAGGTGNGNGTKSAERAETILEHSEGVIAGPFDEPDKATRRK